jgi:hypothetical protein
MVREIQIGCRSSEEKVETTENGVRTKITWSRSEIRMVDKEAKFERITNCSAVLLGADTG